MATRDRPRGPLRPTPQLRHPAERHFLARRIDQIVEVAGIEGRRITLNPLFTGAGADLQWAGTGPAFLPDLETAGFTPAQ